MKQSADYQRKPSYSYTITASDMATPANTSSVSKQVTVVDITDPIITANLVSSINDGLTALGSVSANESVTWSVDNNDLQVNSAGTVSLKQPADYQRKSSYTYTITASDGANPANTNSVTKTVTVVDITDPIITANLVSSINDGTTALGTVLADEPVTWSVDNNDVQVSTRHELQDLPLFQSGHDNSCPGTNAFPASDHNT